MKFIISRQLPFVFRRRVLSSNLLYGKISPDSSDPDGQIIALFPDIPWSEDGSVTSYMHVGQHGAAYYKQVIDSTTPASEEDYSALLAELETIGYDNLRIVKRK